MEIITKEMCMNQTITKQEFRLVYIICIIIEILTTWLIWWRMDSIFWLLFCIAFFGILDIYVLYDRIKRPPEDKEFYIIEDVFLSAQEINVSVNRISAVRCRIRYDYKIKFSRNGTHRVMFFSKKEPTEIDADYSAAFFSKPGDKFYLLMAKNNKEELIIKAFNAKYYKLAEEGFDYIDGKYYPKK